MEALSGPTSQDRLGAPLVYLAGAFIAVSELDVSRASHSAGKHQQTLAGNNNSAVSGLVLSTPRNLVVSVEATCS